MADRDVVSAVLEGSANAITAFAHGGVRKAYGAESFFGSTDGGYVDFDIDDVGINAEHGSTQRLEQHGLRLRDG
jgi:hypothetical protein